jgi:uncharacterized protein (DUF2344 family)
MPKLYLKNEILVQTAKFESLKPRQHVINNLLNYSKALEVNTMKSGKKIALNMN